MENIPAHIFDWIEQTPYATLSSKQKQELQNYISEEEYTNLHQAAIIATGYAKTGKGKVQPQANALQQLHTVFDSTYTEKKRRLAPLVFWQAAASFLLIAVAALSLGWYSAQHQKPQVITHIKMDTVYVNGAKQLPSEIKIYDTVYLEQPTQKQQQRHKAYSLPRNRTIPYKNIVPDNAPLNSVPFSQKDQPQNRPKNNSIKDDTLIQNFNFVQL